MRRCEDEIQTPTIGRTLRSDALGKKEKERKEKKGSERRIEEYR